MCDGNLYFYCEREMNNEESKGEFGVVVFFFRCFYCFMMCFVIVNLYILFFVGFIVVWS